MMSPLLPLLRAWLARLQRPHPASPAKVLADEKRRLEHLLHDAGLSRTQARRVTSEFFK